MTIPLSCWTCPAGTQLDATGNCVTPRQAWQECRDEVAQQQGAPAQKVLQWLEQDYIQIVGLGGGLGGVVGFMLGAAADVVAGPFGNIVGAWLGVHIGALGANEWHTDAVLLFSLLSNLPPLSSSVTAACGPKPSN